MSDHDELRDTAAAWVLGALDDDEALRFAAHLEVCASCRVEVARLRPAADALPLSAPPLPPPPELKGRIMAEVEAGAARRRRGIAGPRRGGHGRARAPRVALAGIAACLLAAGGAVGFALRGEDGPALRTVSADVRAAGATGELVVGGGSAVLRVSDLPVPARGRVYQTWIVRAGRSATPVPDAVFTVDRAGRGSVALRSGLTGVRQVLVTEEPAGGAAVPSREPIVVARPA